MCHRNPEEKEDDGRGKARGPSGEKSPSETHVIPRESAGERQRPIQNRGERKQREEEKNRCAWRSYLTAHLKRKAVIRLGLILRHLHKIASGGNLRLKSGYQKKKGETK